MTSTLSLETREEGEQVRIALEGELDLSSALTFDEEIRRAEERKPKTLVIDLRGLKFLDSTGVRLILSAHSRAKTRGHRLAIVEGGYAVQRIFRLAGVNRRLDILPAPPSV
jgi:anti-anti-sigma factor